MAGQTPPALSACRSELVALANRHGDQVVGDAFASIWPDSMRGPLPVEPVEPAVCGRLLVGQGSDTYDPLCVLPAGHVGICEPEDGGT